MRHAPPSQESRLAIASRIVAFARCAPLALCALLAGCTGCAPDSRDARGASLVLISIDTLRSDHLPVYGYDGVATPSIDGLAARSVVFERAYSQVPLTLPSHATLFTGRLPPQHGVRDNLAFRLAESEVTLAERLRDAGYVTRGVVSSMVLREETGIAQGFARYDDTMPRRGTLQRTFAQRSGEVAVGIAEGWFDELATAGSAPFFVFVHLFEPHTPYAAPAPFAGANGHPYDDEIAWTDALVGRLLAALDRNGLSDELVLVLLSDHGEGLGDHVESEHGLTLYREALQVPMMLRLPGARGAARRVADPVGLVELAPTLLDLLGLPRMGLEGRDLLGAELADAVPIYAETQQTRLQYGWSELRSIVLGDLHYISAPRAEMFDLRQDPAELRNLLPGAAVPPAALWTLEDLGSGEMTTAEVDEETLRQLASLGYVGAVGAPPAGGAPDPKDHIADVEELWTLIRGGEGRSASRRGPPGSAVPDDTRVRHLLATVRGNEALHRAAARGLLRQGRGALAAESLAPYRGSDDPETRVVLGLAASALEQAQDALRHFERAAALEPRHPEAQLGLGTGLLSAGRLGEARERLELAVELDPASAEAWNALGAARIRTDDSAGAGEAWREATRLDPDYADAWFNLALSARDAGDRAATVAALRRYAELVGGRERERALSMLRSLGVEP